MKTKKRWISILMVLFGFSAAGQMLWTTVEPEKEPFWRKKEKVWAKIRQDREVIVAVRSQKSKVSGFREELYMQGAGLAQAPLDLTEKTARQFEDYPKMSRFIKASQFNAGKQELALTTEAFRYVAHLKIQLRFEAPENHQRQIRFRVQEGVFRGLTGVVVFSELAPEETLIAFTGQLPFNTLPMPQFFAEFGLEVALKMMASNMRSYVEAAKSGTKK